MNILSKIIRLAQGRLVTAILSGLLVTGFMMSLYISQPQIIQRLDLKVYDTLLPLRINAAPSPVPVIIDIDERALAEYGQWPWPRYLVANLMKKTGALGAAAIGVDAILSEPDRSSPQLMQEYLKRDKGVDIRFSGLPEALMDYDRFLARTLPDIPIVMGAHARYDGTPQSSVLPPAPGIIERGSKDAIFFDEKIPEASGAIVPLPVLQESAPVGFVNVSADMDGIVRRLPIVVKVDGTVYPSLVLSTLMRAMGQAQFIVFSGPDGMLSVRIGEFSMPVSPEGYMLIPFQGKRKTYPYISAADVLSGKLPPGALDGHIAFVGTSASGLLDIRAIPFDHFIPGVEVHAAALDAILSGNQLQNPAWIPGAQIIGILVAGILATAAFGFARPWLYTAVAGALIGSAIFASRQLFLDGTCISPLYIVMTVVILGTVILLLRFWQEEQQKLVLRNAFSRYVSPEVVKRISKLHGDLFSGEERELSILFTDIRGFTSLSEKLSPQQVVTLLNRYFTPMTAIVRERSGTLDKFIGDALMAFWNAPLDVENHAFAAVDAALAMHEHLARLNDEIEADYGIRLRMGAGIHTGDAYVGNMGSDDLVNYTLIGDAVNTASRLESLCVRYGVPVIISGQTKAQCGNAFAFQYLDTLRVKGKALPIDVYAPMRQADYSSRAEEIAAWQNAHAAYAEGRFTEAKDAFAALVAASPGSPLYTLYSTRTAQLADTPPANWDGIWTVISP